MRTVTDIRTSSGPLCYHLEVAARYWMDSPRSHQSGMATYVVPASVPAGTNIMQICEVNAAVIVWYQGLA